MKKIILSLFIVLAFVSISLTLVKADNSTTIELVDGVQIRTDGNNGLKWVANVTNHNDNNVYGFLFAQGNLTEVTVDTIGVVKQVVEGVSAEQLSMSATLTKFPKKASAQDISVVAYVLADGVYTYSNVVVRNLAETALRAYGTSSAGEFVETVVNYVDANYKSQYVGFDGILSFSSAKYESNPAKLEEEFVADWNAKFGTTWTEFNYDVFNASAIEGTTPLIANTDTNCAGTNAYAFFNTDETTSAKWGWLLNYFLGETATGVHPKLQISALLSETGEYTVTNNSKTYTELYQFKHLSRSLHNFFKVGYEDINDYPSISFTDSTVFAKICEYNNVIYASFPKLVKIDEEVELPVVEKEGYTFDGYSVNESEPSKTYTVTSNNVIVIPQYTAVPYTVKFMNGSEEFTSLTQTYNVEENLFLPTPVVEGYDFIAWYESADFSGDPISTIEFGTTGDKLFYGKFEVQTYVNVNVNFDANGGSFAPTIVPGDSEIEVEKIANYAANTTYLAPATTTSTLQYQNKIILNYNSELNLFEVVATDAASKSLTDAANGATWTHALANSSSNITENISVGQYIYLDIKSLENGVEIAKVFESLDSLTNYSITLKKPESLPTPTNGNEQFSGWRSSLDGSIVTEYPGYMENPGDITYTAMWSAEINANVTFDYNGGISEELYKTNGTTTGTLSITSYNSTDYANELDTNIFIFSADKTVSTWSFRYCIGKNDVTGLYEIKSFVNKVDAMDSLPTGTEYIIAISTGYDGTYDISNLEVGNVILFDKAITSASSSNAVTATFYNSTISNDAVTKSISETSVLDTPIREGYKFGGWYDENDNLYDSASDLLGVSSITLIGKWHSTLNINAEVTFDYNGGITEELIKSNGTAAGSLSISNYNGDFWGLYASDTFIFTVSKGMNPQNSKRVYIAESSISGAYYILGIQTSGVSSIPEGTEFIITISDSYSSTGTYDDNFNVSKLAIGDYVFFDKAFSTASSTNLVNLTFYNVPEINTITQTVTDEIEFDSPVKEGYKFAGWYDENDKPYTTYRDFAGVESITVTAKYVFDDTLIGSFETNSWVEKGSDIKLGYKFVSGSNIAVSWKSETPSIASVDFEGNVSGLTSGLATIVVYAIDAPTISFTYYVTVVENASTMLQVLLNSNNESIYIREDLPIGAGTPAYYYDAVGSVSQLLFENYKEYTSYYVSSPSNKSTLTGSGTGGVDFITFHYAADMPYSANYSLTGGKNLASYNKTCNTNGTGASWHYSTGNDGVWYCQNVAYGAWHAGTSKAMKWYSSGVTTSQVGTDVYTTDVTCGSDNYFYIKGVKTTVTNTTGYSYTKLNDMGLAVKLVGSTWYLGGCYYNSSYKYISSLGGNCNSIGIESSVREASDLWLTWQYSAQLCAKLLIQFNLPIQRLVGHHFFSGKDCPQPMLEYDLEIWYVFREMVEQQMAYFKANGATSSSPKAGATAPTLSTNSSYINSKGRVISLPTYSTCETYTLTYTDGGVSKTVTLSTIIPGTVA